MRAYILAAAIVLNFACAFAPLTTAKAAENEEGFFDYGNTLPKKGKITKAASDSADVKFRVRYIMQEHVDEEADIASLEEAEQFEAIFAPEKRKLAMDNLLASRAP